MSCYFGGGSVPELELLSNVDWTVAAGCQGGGRPVRDIITYN